MSTAEQRAAADFLREQLTRAGLRLRMRPDPEGWPRVPGRYGQVEYLGAPAELHVDTSGRLIRGRLRSVPGVIPSQVGDAEARYRFPADAPVILRAVCRVIGAYRRRLGGGDAEHMAEMSRRASDKRGRQTPGATIAPDPAPGMGARPDAP